MCLPILFRSQVEPQIKSYSPPTLDEVLKNSGENWIRSPTVPRYTGWYETKESVEGVLFSKRTYWNGHYWSTSAFLADRKVARVAAFVIPKNWSDHMAPFTLEKSSSTDTADDIDSLDETIEVSIRIRG